MIINYQFNKDLDGSLMITYKGRTRDYGGTDYSFKDQILDEYLLLNRVEFNHFPMIPEQMGSKAIRNDRKDDSGTIPSVPESSGNG